MGKVEATWENGNPKRVLLGFTLSWGFDEKLFRSESDVKLGLAWLSEAKIIAPSERGVGFRKPLPRRKKAPIHLKTGSFDVFFAILSSKALPNFSSPRFAKKAPSLA